MDNDYNDAEIDEESFLSDDLEVDEAYNRLLEMKKARQAAQENAQKLENRVNLLQKEQQRVLKKIEQVRRKAKDIMKIKQRNEEMQRQKEEAELRRQLELQDKQQKIQSIKQGQDEKINVSKFQTLASMKVMAQNNKEDLKVI